MQWRQSFLQSSTNDVVWNQELTFTYILHQYNSLPQTLSCVEQRESAIAVSHLLYSFSTVTFLKMDVTFSC